MKKLRALKIGVMIFGILGASLLVFLVIHFHTTYKSIFRLSHEEVTELFENNISGCSRISECALLPGDILVRRYITPRTWFMDKIANPYFTHAAWYLGDGKIIEAVGTERPPIKDIQINMLSETDWTDEGIESWVILRPAGIEQEFPVIKANLEAIAVDSEYRFGLPKKGEKITNCADIIYEQLNILPNSTGFQTTRIVSPDYLFSLAFNNPDKFEIVGYF